MGVKIKSHNRTMIAKARRNGVRGWNGTAEPRTKTASLKSHGRRMVTELYGGEPYEFYPLGKYIVAAPAVCRGRPTFKYTRIEVVPILDAMTRSWTVETAVDFYRQVPITKDAVREAVDLASRALHDSTLKLGKHL